MKRGFWLLCVVMLLTAGAVYGEDVVVAGAAAHRDYEDQYVLQKNREAARASFMPFGDRPGDRELSLDGQWRFNWTKHPDEQPADFFLPDFDDSRWELFPVPGDWEVNGYGTPIYCSSGYTFKIDPPRVMGTPKEGYTTYDEHNPTGCYRRTFTLPAGWEGKEVYIHFGGVSSAFYLWVNGREAGYSQGSMEPAEFRLTPYVKAGENTIALEVFKYSDGSYLEDADTWRLAGIHRSVTLYATEQIRIRDFGVRTLLDSTYTDATLIIDPQIAVTGKERGEGCTIQAMLYDADGKVVLDSALKQDVVPVMNLSHKGKIMNERYPQRGYAKWGWLTAEVKNPHKWSAQTPYLYTLRLALVDSVGKTTEQIETKVGFRSIEVSADGRLLINGQQQRMRGVNRPEFDPRHGRVISHELMEEDIRLMKQCNINAVRTSHYPDDPYWYELCDRYGIYVMDEADLEEHGLRGILASDPSWAAAFMDRAQRVVMRDRNHPSVIFWSLGNESGYGPNFAAMSAWIHEYDPTRLVHYEGAQGADGNDPAAVDVTSRFYVRTQDEYHNPGVKDDDMERPENARWERLLSLAQGDNGTRPVMSSEYAHAMGNAIGNLREYWDEIYSHPRMLGGFIWTWVDEGLFKTLPDGRVMTAYGGDFGDKPNLKAFCLNGIIMADRTLTPKYYEVKQVYAPLSIGYSDGTLTVSSLDDLVSPADFSYRWNITENGKVVKSGELDADGRDGNGPLHFPLSTFNYKLSTIKDVRLNVAAVLKEAVPWADAGHEVVSAQFALNDALADAFAVRPSKNVTPVDTQAAMDFLSIIEPHIFRAPTDNDRGFGNWLAKEWATCRLDSPTITLVRPVETISNDDGTVTVNAEYDCTYITISYSYTAYSDGIIDMTATYTPHDDMPTLPCIGSTLRLPASLTNVEWYGRGPYDSYPDRREATHIGLWSARVGADSGSALYVHYPKPQHSGNHDDTAWLQLTDDKGHGYEISTAGQPFTFSVLPYSTAQLTSTAHDCDLTPEPYVYLSLDAATLGLGNSSCGPGVLKKYTITAQPYTLHLVIRRL